jgi:membrane protein
MSWTIILLGAGIAYSIQNVKNFEYEMEVSKLSPQLKTKLALLILHSITQRFTNAEAPQSSLEISEDTEIPHRITKLVLSALVDAELVHEVKTSDEQSFAYAPAFDIEKMDLQSCIDKLHTAGINQLEFKTSESFNTIAKIVDNYKLPDNVGITEIP